MKNWIFKTMFIASLSMSFEAIANSEKIYVQNDHVLVRGKQILVEFGAESIPIARLASDEHGLFIYKEDLPIGFWVCDNGHTNYPWTFICSVCGNLR